MINVSKTIGVDLAVLDKMKNMTPKEYLGLSATQKFAFSMNGVFAESLGIFNLLEWLKSIECVKKKVRWLGVDIESGEDQFFESHKSVEALAGVKINSLKKLGYLVNGVRYEKVKGFIFLDFEGNLIKLDVEKRI